MLFVMFSIKVSYKSQSGNLISLDYGVCSAVLLQIVCNYLSTTYKDESDFSIVLTPSES